MTCAPLRLTWPPCLATTGGAIWICRNSLAGADSLAAWLTARDHADARRHRHPERRRGLLIGRGLLRHAMDQQPGTAQRHGRLRLQANRRPRHSSAIWARQLALSISHTPNWVAVAVAPGAQLGLRIGLDLEDASRQVDPRIGTRLPWPTATLSAGLLGEWTRAEAALKADGRGLAALGRLQGDCAQHLQTDLFRIRTAPLFGLPGFPPAVGALALARPLRHPGDSET